ncbi:oligosaccharide flippase family protein [Sphingomonas sp. Leaf4]|uniref:oligosaccharide flippase family protein n=1 Tax=Sphingomonas sp. Leaf4 TaxID=2876553 RepID=UPI0022A727B2|nr:oligosaccharide flippase family protein [Sphingomonas sp. Leaf4]
MTEGVGNKVRSGVKLTFLTTVASGLLQVVLLVVLSRLLMPRDYGYYIAALALANTSTGLSSSILERTLVVQQGEVAPSGRTATIIFVVVASVALVTFAVAWIATSLTSWTMPPGVLGTLLVAQIIASIGVVPRVNWRRRLLFRRIVFGEMASQIVAGALLSIALSAAGWGAQGLAFAQVFGSIVIVVAVTWGSGLRLSGFRPEELFVLVRSAGQLGRIAALEIANAQIPSLLLTLLAGPTALGLFNRAYTVVQLPVQLLTTSMTRVMISALVLMVDDRNRLQSGMRRLVQFAATIVSPVAFGIAGSHKAFTAVLLGGKWLEAAPLMPFLAIGTWTVMMGYLFSILSEATRHFAQKVRIQVASTLVLVFGIVAGSRFGLIGASGAMAVAGTVFLMFYMWLGAQILGLSVTQVARWMVPGFGAGLLCGISSWLLGQVFADLSPFVQLVIQVGDCGLVTVLFYLVFYRPLLAEIVRMAIPHRFVPRFLD